MKRLNFVKIFILFFIFGFQFLTLSGCGYTTRSAVSTEYKTIYIPPFKNKIDITEEREGNKYKINRPRVESDVTTRVINRYLFDGNIKPTQKEDADIVLMGEVIDFKKDPLRYNDNDEVSEYRMSLVVNISLYDRKADKMLWEENGFTGYTEYYTSAYPLSNVTKKTDDVAITDALDDLARRVVERTVNEW